MRLLPSGAELTAPNCRCYLTPQETTMQVVHAIGRRERDGKLFAIVNAEHVPAGVEHSFRFGGRSHKELVHEYKMFDGSDDHEDLPKHDSSPNGRYTWVRLDDICPLKVLHVTEYDGRIAAVVDARAVPKGMFRGRARWLGLEEFIRDHHPAEAKDVAYQGPTADYLGETHCWFFLDSLFGAATEPAPEAEPEYVTHRGMNGDVVRVRNLTTPVSCGYTAPAPELIDGLTREECFRRYAEAQTTERMREDSTGRRGTLLNTRVSDLALTKAQLEAAREVWSERLREKTEAAAAAAKAADESVVGWNPYEGDE